jgi:hypothetical protein
MRWFDSTSGHQSMSLLLTFLAGFLLFAVHRNYSFTAACISFGFFVLGVAVMMAP